MLRRMYIVDESMPGGEPGRTFVCAACLDDDDHIIEETMDVTCDECEYHDLARED